MTCSRSSTQGEIYSFETLGGKKKKTSQINNLIVKLQELKRNKLNPNIAEERT